jgi:hypothetical protein
MLSAQDSPARGSTSWISIRKSITDLSANGVNLHDCIQVGTDGRFHFERRRQQLPQNHATLEVFESSLSAEQMQDLRNILDDKKIVDLPPFVQPPIPMIATVYLLFQAKITRDGEVRNVGYLSWQGGPPNASPNSAASDVKKGWLQSEEILKPLSGWFAKIEAQKLDATNSPSTFCEVETEPAR